MVNPKDQLHSTSPISIPFSDTQASHSANGYSSKALDNDSVHVNYHDLPSELSAQSSTSSEYQQPSSISNQTSKQAVVNKTRLLGDSVLIKRLHQLANKLANKTLSVLIQGDSGTGKEVLARYIHQQSTRGNQPFHAINCAAIPDTMLESLLFGFEKGVFTGAHKTHLGKFEQANGSTLLLDEISEMPLDLQAKLLRVLQEKEVERLGAVRPESIDVRVIATCNKSLIQCVKNGTFREDLYFRLSVFPLVIPTLRQRPEDIPLLSSYFITRYGNETSFIHQKAVSLLMQYHWPGNIRELENVIQRALLLCDDKLILPEHICFDDVSFTQTEEEVGAGLEVNIKEDGAGQQLNTLQQVIDETQNMSQSLLLAERKLIIEAVHSSGSKKAAASKLGISPRTLRYKIAKLKEQGISVGDKNSMTEGEPHVE